MKIVNIIQYIGLKDLDEQEQAIVKEIIGGNYEKIHRQIKNITNLVVDINVYEKREAAKKYSVHLKVEAPTRIFTAQSVDWDLRRALHALIEKITFEIGHKLKIGVGETKGQLELKKVLRKATRVKERI